MQMAGIGISGTVYIILANHLGLWNINNQQQYSFDTQLHYNIKLVIFRIKIEMFFGSPRHNAGHFLLPSILFPVFFYNLQVLHTLHNLVHVPGLENRRTTRRAPT